MALSGAARTIGQPADPKPLGAAELTRFAEFFYRETGISFEERKLSLVSQRLCGAASASGCIDCRQLVLRAKSDRGGTEMQAIINALTVNETYFYRELHQFEALSSGIMDELAKNRKAGSALRLWSLPCSTGEEPYSMAIHLLENWRGMAGRDVEIIGSDIDSNVLRSARAAVYSERSVSRLPSGVRRRYFTPTEDGRRYALSRDVADAVMVTKANVLDPASTRKFRDLDVIFCRNLLIYFDDSARRAAVSNLYDCLRPGGYVFLGHAESMSRISSIFEPRRHGAQIYYRRPME